MHSATATEPAIITRLAESIIESNGLVQHQCNDIRTALNDQRKEIRDYLASSEGLLFTFAALDRQQQAYNQVLASLEVLRPLPAIAFLPVALLLFNFSLTTELVVMVYASIWPMFINTMGGIANVASRLHDVSLTLKLTPLLKLKYHNAISDAVADLGRPEEIGHLFAGFQKYLYQQAPQ